MHLGFARALERAGFDVYPCLIKDWKRMKSQFLSIGDFDFAIVNDLVHGVGDCPGQLCFADLKGIRAVTSLIIGLVAESVYSYREASGAVPTWVAQRIGNFSGSLPFFDGLWMVDIRDKNSRIFESFEAVELAPFCCEDIRVLSGRPIGRREFIFCGTINEHREAFLSSIGHMNFVIGCPNNEDEKFWNPYVMNMRSMNYSSPQAYMLSISRLAQIRIEAEIFLLKYYASFRGLIHLPTYWRGLHPRFLHAALAGIVPLMPEFHTHPAYGLLPGVHYLSFKPEDPESIKLAVDCLDADPFLEEKISMEARKIALDRFSESSHISTLRDLLKKL